ncbi:MAG: hypothetical protein ACJ763_10560 [Bdellovibrionia bacterium]
MPVRSGLAIISMSYLALWSLSGPSWAFANSWDVYFCPSSVSPEEESCSCSEDSLVVDQEFDLTLLETTGKTYRCIASHKLVEDVGSELQDKNTIAPQFPCKPESEPMSILRVNGKTPPLAQQQFGLPTPALLVSMFPTGCGYAWKDFNVRAYKKTVANFLKTDRITCGNRNEVNCTSATFLVFLSALKKLREHGRVLTSQITEWSDLKGPAWKYLNDLARPDLLMTQLKDARGKPLGTGKTLRNEEIQNTPGWPRPGDFVQFWRDDLSGHSVIFQGFLKDKSGQNIGVCYWSGNYSTNGYGYRCEKIEQIKTMIIGRLDMNFNTSFNTNRDGRP